MRKPFVSARFFREVEDVLNAIEASADAAQLVNSYTEAEQWRLCLVYMLPNDALGEYRAKETVSWLNLLDGVFGKKMAEAE